ncbi:MAG TPA: hypothetical protein VLV18_04560 [Terriglobales bacterium]|nr:hypothetical protein [Terriglobales bacterium]
MRLEYQARRAAILEQHYVHGKWRITKIYVKGKLAEIVVTRLDESAA